MQSAKAAILGASVTTKILCGIVVVLYALSRIEEFRAHFTIIPGAVVPPQTRIWTLITAGFLETHISNVIIDLIALVVAGNLFEPLWGRDEYLRFLFVVIIITNIAVVFTFIALYAATERIELLFFEFSGLSSFLTSLTIAFRQSFTNTNYFIYNFSFDNSKGPLLSLIICFTLAMIGLIPTSQLLLAVYGVVVAWLYLRFYQRHNGSRGDFSDTFAFAEFFPYPLNGIVAALGTVIFNVLVALHICSSVQQIDLAAAHTINIVIPGSNISDAERRKQIALRDLNSRLKLVEGKTVTNNDSAPAPPISAPVAENTSSSS